MSRYIIPRICKLQDIPEFQRFQANNIGHIIDEHQTAVMYGRAIHWISFFQILWPPFDKVDFYMEEVRTIVHNDPDRDVLPIAFYRQITEILKTFWTLQLTDLYPDGDWTVEVIDDSEMTIQATIRKRHK
jgi:hypothetical protein